MKHFVIHLRTAPNRMGNSSHLYFVVNHGQIVTVSQSRPHALSVGLEIKVAPSEIKNAIAMAKRTGIYSA